MTPVHHGSRIKGCFAGHIAPEQGQSKVFTMLDQFVGQPVSIPGPWRGWGTGAVLSGGDAVSEGGVGNAECAMRSCRERAPSRRSGQTLRPRGLFCLLARYAMASRSLRE
jgi:hypothetical protein